MQETVQQMKIYDYSEQYAACAVCGDIHGRFDFLIGEMKRLELTDTLVIVAGDCGIGFDDPDYYQYVYDDDTSILAKASYIRSMRSIAVCFWCGATMTTRSISSGN